ncbi:MAG: trimethylamine methyltransferase family protein [Candidatus Hodarchaeota archaeon]
MVIRPKLRLLDDNQVKMVVEQAFDILENLGIIIENQEALTLLKNEGITADSNDRVLFPSDLVHKAIKNAPNTIYLYNRVGDLAVRYEDDYICFDPGSAAINILDSNTNEIRKPVTEDYIKYAKLVEQLKHIHAQSTAFICSDVPKENEDSYRLYLSLLHCSKPVITGTFRKESFEKMKDMLVAVRGDEKILREKPLAVFDACPSPPLRWSDLTCQSVIDAAKLGIPSQLISMPMTGANAPASIFGAIVQHCAETLSGIAICQLVSPGSPIIWGGSPSAFDMRNGTTPMGAIGTMMIDVAYSQVGKHLGFPVHTYMGLSDSKVLDAQAGLETGIGAILAALGGINMISGPGMLDFESCFSLEKLVIDNEICGMALRLIEGIKSHEEISTKELLAEYEESKQLLSHPTTRKIYRKEFYFPSLVIDRTTRDVWAKQRTTATDRAHNLIQDLIQKESSITLDPEVELTLKKIIEL